MLNLFYVNRVKVLKYMGKVWQISIDTAFDVRIHFHVEHIDTENLCRLFLRIFDLPVCVRILLLHF